MPILQYCDIYLSYVCESAQVKLLLEIPKKCCQNTSETLSGSRNFQKFSGGACPQTPLGGLWAYAHSITIVTVHNQMSDPPPPHFYYLFSALGGGEHYTFMNTQIQTQSFNPLVNY